MKIYIEDITSNEITINDTPCRKIGDLKNGEEKTFQITEQATKIFVIADSLSKNYCNDYYQLSDGQENIFLSGRNEFNLANGNAFRFDNNESEGIAENRKRGTKKGLLVLIIAIVVGAVIGYSVSFGLVSGLFLNKTPEVKTFSSNGMTITLTDEFRETNLENYTVTYESDDVVVFALQEAFTLVDGFEDYTLEEYADLVFVVNSLDSAELKTAEGLNYFEYDFTDPQTNDVYQYFSYVYKTDDSFWMVQFATLEENAEKYSQQITEWAKSIEFSH